MKVVPVIVTDVPPPPLVGLKLVIVGAGMTVKLDALVAVPPGVVTEMVPVVAPAGTVAVICVAELTMNALADVPLKETALAPVKFVPVMATDVPTGPLVGLKLVMVGAGEDCVTVKFTLNGPFAEPALPTTTTVPDVALFGTVAVIVVSEMTVKLAYSLFPKVSNITSLAFVNPVPVIVTVDPGGPLVGEIPVVVACALAAV